MVQTLGNMAKQLNELWQNMEKANRWRLIIVSSLLIIVAIGAALLMNRREYAVLYTNLASKDAGEILNKLTEMKVDAKPQGTGTILVPKDQEARIRMQLSSEGYPKSGLNYDLFMGQTGFGTTDFEKQKYLLFQLQDRLQNTIKTLEGVEDAIVTISMPEQDSFVLKEDKQPTTASVLLKIKDGVGLAPRQVKGIKELMLKSVLGLTPENISIIDSNMNVLGGEESEGAQAANTQLDLENQVRKQIQDRILSILEPVFGYRKVVVAANVKLDFDKKVQESIKYEPVADDSGIAVSVNELKEKVSNSGGAAGGVPGTSSNGGTGGTPQYPASQEANGDYEKTNRVTSYQVNQIKEQLEKAQGQIQDLSVSVMIDNNQITPDVTNNVREIVASAAGIDQSRVVVQNMAFNGNKALQQELAQNLNTHQKSSPSDLMKDILLYGGIGAAVILLLYITIRAASRGEHPSVIPGESELSPPTLVSETAEIRFDDREAASIQKQVEKFAQHRPEAVAQLLRTWLNED